MMNMNWVECLSYALFITYLLYHFSMQDAWNFLQVKLFKIKPFLTKAEFIMLSLNLNSLS